jgi:hypothetical protein
VRTSESYNKPKNYGDSMLKPVGLRDDMWAVWPGPPGWGMVLGRQLIIKNLCTSNFSTVLK